MGVGVGGERGWGGSLPKVVQKREGGETFTVAAHVGSGWFSHTHAVEGFVVWTAAAAALTTVSLCLKKNMQSSRCEQRK